MRKTSLRSAFTLVEMLVVISIISILMAVLIPAISAARESMRRTDCANNLKQIGLALTAYESTNQMYPAGEIHGTSADTGYSAWGSGNANHCSWDGRIGMWLNAIYPQLELNNYYEQIDFTVTPQYDNTTNKAIYPNKDNQLEMRREIPGFRCPSDTLDRGALTTAWGRSGENSESKNQCAILNYFGVGGSMIGSNVPHPDNSAANSDLLCNVTDGMFYNDSQIRGSHIKDGTTYTAMVAETWGRIYPNHYAGDGSTPPPLGYPTEERSRGMNGQAVVFFDYPPNSDNPDLNPAANKIPQAERGSPNRVKSFHTGGCNVLYVDGAVHFVNESVQYQQVVSGTTYPGVWRYMATINGRDVVNPKHLNWR